MKKPVSGGRREAMRRILCLWLPNWPIQCALVSLAGRKDQKSEIRGQRSENAASNHSEFCVLNSTLPILLHSRDPRRGEIVVACNQTAIERGARLQMPLAE